MSVAAQNRTAPRWTVMAVLAVAGALGAGPAAGAAVVGQAYFVIGDVVARGEDGTVRELARGTPIHNGDLIDTRDGRAQLRFTDGALVSLQPRSQFRVDDYRFHGRADGTEKGFFSLLQGGLRTVTGIVGRFNQDAYQITTPTATIGIRGTEYLASLGRSLTVSVGEGRVAVINRTGEFIAEAGQTVHVRDQDSLPELTSEKPFLPPPGTQAGNTPPAPPGYVAGDSYTADGQPQWLALGVRPPPPRPPDPPVTPPPVPGPFPDGPGYEVGVGAGTGAFSLGPSCPGNRACGAAPLVTATFGGDGLITGYAVQGETLANLSATVAGGYDGAIGWARFSNGVVVVNGSNVALGDKQGLHAVWGVPTPQFTSGGTGTFNLAGFTVPTFSDNVGAGLGTGTVTAGQMVVNFPARQVAVMSATIAFSGPGGASTYQLSARGLAIPAPGAGFSGSGQTAFTGGAVNVCGGASCPTGIAGLIAGPSANRAAAVYKIDTVSGFTIDGALGYRR
jgi:hypothetical protein